MIEDRVRYAKQWELLCRRFSREPDAEEAKAYRLWLEARGMDDEEWQRAFEAIYGTAKFWPEPASFLVSRFNRDWWVATQMLAGRHEYYRSFSQIGREVWSELGGTDPFIGLGKIPAVHARKHFLEACTGRVTAQEPAGLLAPGGADARPRIGRHAGGGRGLTAIEVPALPPAPSDG